MREEPTMIENMTLTTLHHRHELAGAKRPARRIAMMIRRLSDADRCH